MKASKQALGAAAMLALAAGPAAADSASTTMSVSVQVVAPGSLGGLVVGSGQAGQDSLGEPIGAVHTAAPSPQGSAVPSVESGAAGDEALQPK